MSDDNLVQWFLQHGADPNKANSRGITPMRSAAREASIGSLRLLVERGGRIKQTDLVAQAAIGHSWGRRGRLEVIEYLLSLGALIDAMAIKDEGYSINNGGQTALNVASIAGDEELARWLLERGANADIAPINGDLIEEFPYRGEKNDRM